MRSNVSASKLIHNRECGHTVNRARTGIGLPGSFRDSKFHPSATLSLTLFKDNEDAGSDLWAVAGSCTLKKEYYCSFSGCISLKLCTQPNLNDAPVSSGFVCIRCASSSRSGSRSFERVAWLSMSFIIFKRTPGCTMIVLRSDNVRSLLISASHQVPPIRLRHSDSHSDSQIHLRTDILGRKSFEKTSLLVIPD